MTEFVSGKRIPSEVVLYSAGPRGAVDALDLANAGIEHDERGRIAVDERYRTSVPGARAVSEVIGFLSLTATIGRPTSSAAGRPRSSTSDRVVMSSEGTVDALVGTVFNYPTLAESYKVAALDVTNKLHALSRLSV